MRRLIVIAFAAVLVAGFSPSASAGKVKTKPAVLRCVQQDGFTVNPCFTSGTSADGGGKAITVDGDPAHPTATSSIAFDNWWCQKLETVQQLKISTQEPVTPGSPRISILLADSNCNYTGQNLFLSPFYCNSSNGNGWRTSNWRSDGNCTLFFDTEPAGYAGWNAFTAAHPNQYIYFAFVVQDEAQASRVDRIQLDTQLFTK